MSEKACMLNQQPNTRISQCVLWSLISIRYRQNKKRVNKKEEEIVVIITWKPSNDSNDRKFFLVSDRSQKWSLLKYLLFAFVFVFFCVFFVALFCTLNQMWFDAKCVCNSCVRFDESLRKTAFVHKYLQWTHRNSHCQRKKPRLQSPFVCHLVRSFCFCIVFARSENIELSTGNHFACGKNTFLLFGTPYTIAISQHLWNEDAFQSKFVKRKIPTNALSIIENWGIR